MPGDPVQPLPGASEEAPEVDGPIPPELEPYELKPGDPVPADLEPPAPGEEWNAPQHFAQSQRFIACWLLTILSGSLIAAWLALFLHVDLEKVKELMTITFAPVIGLAGAATGFYFGERNAEQEGRRVQRRRR